MDSGAPILMRSFKKESEIEVWKRGRDGKYALLKTYPMCRWSGQLGPKVREGDRQAPEGFYEVAAASMNPNSSLFLSFNIGYPNAFDRSHRRTGSQLMVHGACSSQGCFAMTDEAMSEVYALAREAFAAGQRSFQFQSYPFRMTADNLAKHRADAHFPFWKNLKEGSDIFEVTGQEAAWTVSAGSYKFGADSAFLRDIAAKVSQDEREVAALIAKGTPAIRVVYQDGGGHPSLKKLALAAAAGPSPELDEKTRQSVGDVSRPDALASEPRELRIEAAPARSVPTYRGRAARNQIQSDAAVSAADRGPAFSFTESGRAPTTTTTERSSFTDRFRSWFAN
jgi:murein L,D-transpeptidase YafK